MHKRDVPSATGNLLKSKAGRLFCANTTKQGLLLDLTTLRDTWCLSPLHLSQKKGMLARALPAGACSSFPAHLPPLPLILQGKQQRGLPQAQRSVWNRKENTGTAHHSTRARGHRATFRQNREEGLRTEAQICKQICRQRLLANTDDKFPSVCP